MRSVELLKEDGITNYKSDIVKIGFVYKLIEPVNIKDTSGKLQSSTTEVILQTRITRSLQRKWANILNDEERADVMIYDSFRIDKITLDELSVIDYANMLSLVTAFLPQSTL